MNAHENHIEWPTTPNTHNKIASVSTAHAPAPPPKSEIKETKMAAGESRLHPLVQDKIRLLVAGGETRLYAIRKQLRLVPIDHYIISLIIRRFFENEKLHFRCPPIMYVFNVRAESSWRKNCLKVLITCLTGII